ncbi:ribosomal protein L22e [Neoconidiobolus thromboides FSU 785]|nr:ribosomal protein L22e [Neoconidiobolus thromboides FSU 785]
MSAAKVAKPTNSKFVIDCSTPAKDGIFDAAAFEKFLHDRVKVAGRTNNLGSNVKISRSTDNKLTVTSKVPFAKRYFKYLTKKYLKKHSIRDWVRVVATNKATYKLRYYNVDNNLGDEEEEE